MSYSSYGHPRRKRRGCGLTTLVVLLVVVLAALGIGEVMLRKQMEEQLAAAASKEMHSPTEAHLGGLALLAYATGKASSVQLTSSGGQDGSGEFSPAFDLTLRDVSYRDNDAVAGSLSGTVTLSSQDMLATASSSSDGSLLRQFVEVKEIRPDVAAGVLDVDLGGLATMKMEPQVKDGHLEFAPRDVEFLGIEIPSNLLGGAVSMVNETVDKLPDGVTVSGTRVTEKGLDVEVSGTNVPLRHS